MSEAQGQVTDVKPAAGAAVDAGAVKAAAEKSATGEQPAGNGVKEPEGGGGEQEQPVASSWRDDWREQLAGNDEKELTRLKRFKSPENVYKSLRELENRLRTGGLKPTLDETATDAEKAEYRKANGIPNEPTPEAYGVKFPEGYEATDADKADMGAFLADMHGANIPQDTVQKVWQTYLGVREKADQQFYEAAQAQTINNKAELKAEFGRDFTRNLRLGNTHLITALGEEKAKGIAALTLGDGTKLGDHPDFVRYIVGQALASADDATLATSEFGGGGASLEDQYDAALNLRYTDKAKYDSPEHQAKLTKLAAAKVARKAA